MAGEKRVKRYIGVYYRDSKIRKHNGKPDRCFSFIYTDMGGAEKRNVQVKVGWASEGYTAQFASDERARYIQRMRHGELSPDGRRSEITFGEAFALYYETHAQLNKTTHADDLSCYRTHLEKRFRSRKLSSITKHDLEQIKVDLMPPVDPKEQQRRIKDNGGEKPWLENSSVRRIFMLVSVVYNKMIKWPEKSGYKGTNPVARVDIPKPSRKRERALTEQEAETILLNLKEVSIPTYREAMMSLETGMRMGEVYRVRWRNVDLANKVVNIPVAKGGTDQKVFLPERIWKELRRMSVGADPHSFVFPNINGGQKREISNTFQRTVDALGFNDGVTDSVDKVVPHTLRHSYATWLAQSGKVDIYGLQSIMRHKSFTTTLRYIHLIPTHTGHVAAGVISEIFPDKQIESFDDVLKLKPSEVSQMLEGQEEYYGKLYADDPEQS